MRTEPTNESAPPLAGLSPLPEMAAGAGPPVSANGEIAVASVFSSVLQRIHAAASEAELADEAEAGLRRLAELVPDRRHVAELQRLVDVHREQCRARFRPDCRPASAPEPDQPQPTDYLQFQLTEREAEVLGWVTRGKRDAEIGKILGISVRTVGKHVENLLRKLHVENRSAAAAAVRIHRMRSGPA